VRYNPDGSLDPSFGTGGIVTTDLTSPGTRSTTQNTDFASSVVIEPDGKIIVAGTTFNQGSYNTYGTIIGTTPFTVALVRYDSNGSLDPTFGKDGIAVTRLTSLDYGNAAVALQPDGDIVVAYSARANPVFGSGFGVARFLGLDLKIGGPILDLVGRKATFVGSFDDETTADTTGVTWSFGDGTTLTFGSAAAPGALTPTHVYKKFGIYDVTLTIRFASGGTATARRLIFILPSFGGSYGSGDAMVFDDAMAALTVGQEADPTLLELATEVFRKSKPRGSTGGVAATQGSVR
jgi:uncharacterized delta-60 repeat protein